jgi:hypothetical protein
MERRLGVRNTLVLKADGNRELAVVPVYSTQGFAARRGTQLGTVLQVEPPRTGGRPSGSTTRRGSLRQPSTYRIENDGHRTKAFAMPAPGGATANQKVRRYVKCKRSASPLLALS